MSRHRPLRPSRFARGHRPRLPFPALLACATAGLFPGSAFATPVASSWQSTAGGNWTEVSKWSHNPARTAFPYNNGTDTFNVTVGLSYFAPYYVSVTTPFVANGADQDHLSVDNLTLAANNAIVYQYGPLSDLRVLNTLTISSGTYQLSEGSLTVGAVNLTGGTLKLAGGTLAPTDLTLNGGTVVGGTLYTTGAGRLRLTNNSNVLEGTTLVGGLVFDQTSSRLTLHNDATFAPSDATLGGTSNFLVFESTASDHDAVVSSTINLDGVGPSVMLAGPGGMALTLTPTGLMRGRGTFYAGGSYSGTFAFNNQGAVSADLAGQTLGLYPTVLTNTAGATLRAVNGATLLIDTLTSFNNQPGATLSVTGGSSLYLQKNWHNAGTLVLADSSVLNLRGTFTQADLGLAGWIRNGGTVNIQGTLDNTGSTLALDASTGNFTLGDGMITGGTVTTTPSGRLIFTSAGGNILDGVTVAGDALFDQAYGRVRLRNDASFGGDITIAQTGAIIAFEGTATDPTATFSRTINLNANSARLALEGTTPSLTLTPTAVVRGMGAVTFGSINGVSGLAEILNQGLVSADIAGQTLTLSTLKFTNESGATVRAINGATLVVSPSTSFSSPVSTFENLPGGTISVSGGSTLTLQRAWHNAGAVSLQDSSVINLQGAFTTADLGADGWVRNGGTVNLQGGLDNTGASLSLAPLGDLVLSGGTITGGTITPSPSGRLVFSGLIANLLDGVTHAGPLLLDQSLSRIRLRNDATFNGYAATLAGSSVLSFEASASDPTAVLDHATVHLAATSSLSLDGPNPVLTVSSSARVRGAGFVTSNRGAGFSGTATLLNDGLISADVSGQTLECNLLSLVNTGVLEAKNGASLRLASAQATQSAGTFRLGGGFLQLSGNASGPDMSVGVSARLEGFGEVRFYNAGTDSLALAGTLAPGPGAGGLVIKGDLVPAASATFAFDLAGPAQGTGYDFVSEAGGTPINLAGATLAVTLARGYTPGAAQTFTLLTSNQPLAGAFGNVASGARLVTTGGHGSFLVTYAGGSSVTLSDFQPSPQAAFLDWMDGFLPGETDPALSGPSADPDGDGAPNLLEFALHGDPLAPAARGLSATLLQDVDPAAGLEFTYVIACRAGTVFAAQPGGAQANDTAIDNLRYTVEGSTDLSDLTRVVRHLGPSPVAPAATGLPDLTGSGWEYHTFYLDPAGLGPRAFLRLQVDFGP